MLPFFQFNVHMEQANTQQRKSYSQWSGGQPAVCSTACWMCCSVNCATIFTGFAVGTGARHNILFFQIPFVVEQELCYWIKMHGVVSCRPVVAGPCAQSAGKNFLPGNF